MDVRPRRPQYRVYIDKVHRTADPPIEREGGKHEIHFGLPLW